MSIDHAISAVRSGIDLIKTSDQRMSIQVGFCFCFVFLLLAGWSYFEFLDSPFRQPTSF